MCRAVVYSMQARIKLKFSSTIIIISRWRFLDISQNAEKYANVYLWLLRLLEYLKRS